MAIVNDDNLINEDFTNEIDTNYNTITITSKSNKSIATDNRYTPRVNLLTHISGSSWTVTYYSQVLNKDSIVSNQQLSVSAINQQYRKICNFELKVTSPLSSSQDQATKSMSSSGEAMLYPFIIPQDGDVFIADIGNGKSLIFGVTSTTKLSIYKESCFQISYVSDSESIDKIRDLDNKTIETLHYSKELVKYGKYPIVISNDYNTTLNLSKLYYIITDYYFGNFFNREYKTLLLPNQSTPTYDHFLVSFILSTFNTSDSDNIKHIIKYNVQDDEVLNTDSVFSIIKDRDISKMDHIFKTYGMVYAKQFARNAKSYVISYSGISRVIYPVLLDEDIYGNNRKLMPLDKLNLSIVKPMHLPSSDNLSSITPVVPVNHTPSINDIDYVFSKEFYYNSPTMSVLERLVMDYISNISIPVSQVHEMLKKVRDLSTLEQFYYIPILLRITKSIIEGDN